MGHVFHTGVGGMLLTATSGVGYLSRTRGLCGHWLLEVTMVMHDGRVLIVNKEENADLFWGLPAAGANFGIVTRFKFKLTKVASTVLAGDVVRFPKGEGPPCRNSGLTRFELAKQWTDFFKTAPDECATLIVLAGKGPVVGRITYIPKEGATDDGIAKGREAFAPILNSATSLVNTVKPRNYWSGLQKMGKFMPSYYYQKAVNVETDFPDDILQKLADLAQECPVSNDGSAIILMSLEGKLKELSPEDGPSSHVMGRCKWWAIIIAEFPAGNKKPELRQSCIDWVRKAYDTIKHLGVGAKRIPTGDASRVRQKS